MTLFRLFSSFSRRPVTRSFSTVGLTVALAACAAGTNGFADGGGDTGSGPVTDAPRRVEANLETGTTSVDGAVSLPGDDEERDGATSASDAPTKLDTGDGTVGLRGDGAVPDGTSGFEAGTDARADAPPAPEAGEGGTDANVDSGTHCSSPTDCPPGANACILATCTGGVCGRVFVPTGTAIAAQTAGDCQTLECDGNGDVQSVTDDSDVPTSSSPCVTPTCTNGVPSTPPVASGTACGQGDVCDGDGHCVGCVNPGECPGTDTDCQTRTCILQTCGFSFTAANTPTSQQTAGDCHDNVCDGQGNVTSAIDDSDVPSSANQCETGVCTAGTPGTSDVAAGNACSQNDGMECDGAGSCVACLTASDCAGTDTACAVRTCTAGQCGVSFTPSGSPVGAQTAGNCHANECDGAGNAVTVVDDGNVPSSTNQCVPGSCSNGTPGTTNAAQGTACTQSGGRLCDGAGTCTQTVTVVRVGNGAAALGSTAAATFLETYYPVAGATLVGNALALPTTVSGSNQPLLLTGSSTSEGDLSASGDGHYLVLAGYAVTAGSATTSGTRVVGRVDASGDVDTTTRLASAAFSGSSVRGAASIDGSHFWISGTSSTASGGGLWYAALGVNGGGAQLTDTPNNFRGVAVYANALYGASGTTAYDGVLSFGGLPTTTGATATLLPNMATASPGGFVLLDLNGNVPGVDTLYVGDNASGLERWTFDGTNWNEDTTFTVLTGGCLGVTGWSNGSGVTLVASMISGTLERVDVPTTGSPAATPIVSAAGNTAYRGVAIAAH